MSLIDEIVQEQFLCNGSSKKYTMEIMKKINDLREAIKEEEGK